MMESSFLEARRAQTLDEESVQRQGAAALTSAAAVVAVLAVREVVVRIIHPDPAFTPLGLGSPIVATIVCTMVAVYVFIGMVSYPNPVRTWRRVLEGSALHVTVGDGNEPFEFIVTLKDGTHAEIHPKGAPPKMKPIPAEKIH